MVRAMLLKPPRFMKYCVAPLITSFSRVMKTAPKMEPGMLPNPPMMIMAMYSMDRSRPKGSGVMLRNVIGPEAARKTCIERADGKGEKLVPEDGDAHTFRGPVVVADGNERAAEACPEEIDGNPGHQDKTGRI